MKSEARERDFDTREFDWETLVGHYVDAVRAELDGLSAGDEEIVIPLSGTDSLSVAEYEQRFGAASPRHPRSMTIASTTPMHIALRAKRSCRRRGS